MVAENEILDPANRPLLRYVAETLVQEQSREPSARRGQFSEYSISRFGDSTVSNLNGGSTKEVAKQLPKSKEKFRDDFRKKCDALLLELRRLDDYWIDEQLADEGLEVTVELRQLLSDVYVCEWGKSDCLKRSVVVIESQIGNASWTKPLAKFVEAAISLIRLRYLIDEQVVEEILDLVEAHGLDPFRGTVSQPQVRKQFVIQEV